MSVRETRAPEYSDHGGIVYQMAQKDRRIAELEAELRREREHPDRLRGQAAREAFEAWARCKR